MSLVIDNRPADYCQLYSLWSSVIEIVVFSLSCVSTGDVQASAVPALTAANETEKNNWQYLKSRREDA